MLSEKGRGERVTLESCYVHEVCWQTKSVAMHLTKLRGSRDCWDGHSYILIYFLLQPLQVGRDRSPVIL